MTHLENNTFNKLNKPTIYIRYIDAIFVQTKTVNDIIEVKENFEMIPC